MEPRAATGRRRRALQGKEGNDFRALTSGWQPRVYPDLGLNVVAAGQPQECRESQGLSVVAGQPQECRVEDTTHP